MEKAIISDKHWEVHIIMIFYIFYIFTFFFYFYKMMNKTNVHQACLCFFYSIYEGYLNRTGIQS